MATIADRADAYAASLGRYLRENASLISVLALLAVAAYGFELFNLNLTIDEESRAFLPDGSAYISHGRWGLFLLDKFLLPYPIIPFVPLFIALVGHIGAVLLLLDAWEVDSTLERFTVATLGFAHPAAAFLYMFGMMNYAVGIGLLCCALSLLVYTRSTGRERFLAVIPAVLALSIYQPFAVVLAAIFAISILSSGLRAGGQGLAYRNVAGMLLVGGFSLAAYWLINAGFLAVSGRTTIYVDEVLHLRYLRDDPAAVIARTLEMLGQVYAGSKSVYAIEIRTLGVVVGLSLCGLVAATLQSSLRKSQQVLVCLLAIVLLSLPFTVGLFMADRIQVRFMIALPFVISGIAALGMRVKWRNFRLLMALCIGYCVFQFVVSINYLNSASHFALAADRVLASQLIGRIEDARVSAGVQELKYLEVIGYHARPSSPMMPKIDTFGASFFEWDQGSAGRIVLFLRTLGYFNHVEPMPVHERGQQFETARAMPAWPAPGSVKVNGNAVIIKFGEYSSIQKRGICETNRQREFCGNN